MILHSGIDLPHQMRNYVQNSGMTEIFCITEIFFKLDFISSFTTWIVSFPKDPIDRYDVNIGE